MIQIDSLSVLVAAPILPAIKEHLTAYIKSVLESFGCADLKKCGCVYYLETHGDMQKYHDMGLSQPLKDTPFEYCEIVSLDNSHGEIKLLHGCYLTNNDFAVDIWGCENVFDKVTTQAFLDNTAEKGF